MNDERIRRTAICFVVVMASLSARMAGQDQPDLSGSWILESGTFGADIPPGIGQNGAKFGRLTQMRVFAW